MRDLARGQKMRNKLSLLLAACLGLAVITIAVASRQAMAQTPIETVTFKTPEDAVTSYMQGIATGEADKILPACAIDEVNKNFKLDAYIDRLHGFLPLTFMAPTNYPLYTEINKAQITSDILRQVKTFEYSLLSNEDVTSGNMIYDPSADEIAKFVKDVDPSRLSKIT